jgi:hypothetical protein
MDPRGQEQAEAQEPVDFAARELCGDGSCVGVIGDDQRCRVCGQPGVARRADASAAAPSDGSSERADEVGDDEVDSDARRLCPDGACVGLLGPDGHCKVCGSRT